MRTERGSILILSSVFITILLLWQAAFLQRSLVELRAAETLVDTTQAFHVAEAGLLRSQKFANSLSHVE